MGIAPSRFGKLLAFLLLFLCLVMLGSTPAQGGGAGSLDPTFSSGSYLFPIPIIRGKVNYGDGRSLLYGNFTIVASKTYSNLVRLNADGSVDATFNFPISPSTDVRAACLLAGGQILVGGTFGLKRVNSDGTVDNTLLPTITSPYGTVNALAMQADGKILVGGCSFTVQGDSNNSYHLVRLQPDWSLDPIYPPRIGAGGYVTSIELLNDDPLNPDRARVYGILPAPYYTDYLLVLYNNGYEEWSIGAETVNGPINAMVTQPDGKMVLAGQFTAVKGYAYNGIVRLNSDLSVDTSFAIGSGFSGGRVSSLVLQGDGKIVAAGNFTSFNGAPCGYIARLNPDGSRDFTFGNYGSGASDRIFRMEADGSNLNIYGAFTYFGSSPHRCIAVLTGEGFPTIAYAFSTVYWVPVSSVYAQALQPDGKILVGGYFTGAGSPFGAPGLYHEGIARFNANGSLDSSFRPDVDGVVKSIALQPDGKILLGGLFWAVNGYARTSLARLYPDGSLDTGFNPSVTQQNGAVGRVNRVAWLSSSSQIMIGGLFGYPKASLARLNSSGSTDASFTPQYPSGVGPSQEVLALADNVGRYVVGGSGTSGGFLTRFTYTGLLDPTFGSTAPPTPAPNAILFIPGGVNDLFIQGDGKIVAGGNFTNINDGSTNPPRGSVARFTTNGALDSGFTTNPGANNLIYAVAQQSGGRVLIGGNFTLYNGISRNRIARLNSNGSLDYSFNPGTGANATVWTILPSGSNKALIGGLFSTYYNLNINRRCLARIKTTADTPVAATFLLLD